MTKDLTIRNSTVEFLIFTSQAGEESIEVKYAEGTVWLSQKMMAKLFEVSLPTVNEHLKNIFNTGELNENSVIRNFLITASGSNKATKKLLKKEIKKTKMPQTTLNGEELEENSFWAEGSFAEDNLYGDCLK